MLAQPGIFQGYVLSTPQGHLTPGQQAAVLAYVRQNASLQTGHQIRLVLEGRRSVDQLSAQCLAEMRLLAEKFLAC